MKQLIKIIVVLLGLFLLEGCTNSTSNDVPPPEKVQLVSKTAEDDSLERGIDALDGKNAIYLEWYSQENRHLAGYVIYRSEKGTQDFGEIGRVEKYYGIIDTTFIDDSVQVGAQQRYYYYVRAFDELGQFGPPSDTVNYSLVGMPLLSYPVNVTVTETQPRFIWDFSYIPHEFIFRLQIKKGENYYYLTKPFRQIVEYEPHQEWQLTDLGYNSPLTTGMSYRWRIDVVGSEDSQGAESAWAEFRVGTGK